MTTIAIILTIFNRRETTLKGLRSLYEAIKYAGEGYSFDVYMTDDGSTDGTAEAVRDNFPEVIIIQGNGKLYWSRGMNLAWKEATKSKNYDFFVWWNDDSILYEVAFETLFAPIRSGDNNIIVSGAFVDSQGHTAYGGSAIKEKYIILDPNGTPQRIMLMNGNFTLIPKDVFNRLGYIDKHFIHGEGDWDYGLRANEEGIKVVITSEYVGMVNRHDPPVMSHIDGSKTLFYRIKAYNSEKHGAKAHRYFMIKHFGVKGYLKDIFATIIYILFPCVWRIRHK